MIDVIQIGKPKETGTGGSGTTSRAGAYLGGTVDEARHAAKADLATFAEQSDYANRAGYASRSAYADIAGDLAEDSPAFTKFLSRLVADIAEGHITFQSGFNRSWACHI